MIQQELADLGITAPDSGIASFDVEETHPHWATIAKWITRRNAVDIIRTSFSAKEIKNAKTLSLEPDWHHGYPQPEDGTPNFRQVTYDSSQWCEECEVGLRQIAPFQMKGEPRWGKRSILQLNWIFDEFFTTPHAWSDVFKPFGVEYRPVMNTKGAELSSVVQLVIRDTVGLIESALPQGVKCTQCGRMKYRPHVRGRFPSLRNDLPSAICKSEEYFGSGGSAFQAVIVSQALANAMIEAGLRGASFHPVEEAAG